MLRIDHQMLHNGALLFSEGRSIAGKDSRCSMFPEVFFQSQKERGLFLDLLKEEMGETQGKEGLSIRKR
jgi:hypothetical protein